MFRKRGQSEDQTDSRPMRGPDDAGTLGTRSMKTSRVIALVAVASVAAFFLGVFATNDELLGAGTDIDASGTQETSPSSTANPPDATVSPNTSLARETTTTTTSQAERDSVYVMAPDGTNQAWIASGADPAWYETQIAFNGD